MDTITSTTKQELLVGKLTDPGNIGNLIDRRIVHSIDLHVVEDTTTRLELAVSHSKESKRFGATLMVVGVEDRGTYSVTIATPFTSSRAQRLPSLPVARYSATALMAFRTQTMQLLKDDPSWLDGLDLGPWGTPPADPASGSLTAGGGISAIAKF